MWSAISVVGGLVSTLVGFYITGKKTRADLDLAFYEFARLRGSRNESADDRESVENQKKRLAIERDLAQEKALKLLDESLAKEAERIRVEKIAAMSDAHARALEDLKKP